MPLNFRLAGQWSWSAVCPFRGCFPAGSAKVTAKSENGGWAVSPSTPPGPVYVRFGITTLLTADDLPPTVDETTAPFFMALCEDGPVERHAPKFEPDAGGYIGKCHFCLELRWHLIELGTFTELRPAERRNGGNVSILNTSTAPSYFDRMDESRSEFPEVAPSHDHVLFAHR